MLVNSVGRQKSAVCSKSWPTFYVGQQCWPFTNLFVLCWPTSGKSCAVIGWLQNGWTSDDAIVELIYLYEKHPCLYDTSLNEYRHKNLKRIVEAGFVEKLLKTGQFTNYSAK